MLAVPRRIAEGDKVARSGDWTGWAPPACWGIALMANGLVLSVWAGSALQWHAAHAVWAQHPLSQSQTRASETEAELEATYWDR